MLKNLDQIQRDSGSIHMESAVVSFDYKWQPFFSFERLYSNKISNDILAFGNHVFEQEVIIIITHFSYQYVIKTIVIGYLQMVNRRYIYKLIQDSIIR